MDRWYCSRANRINASGETVRIGIKGITSTLGFYFHIYGYLLSRRLPVCFIHKVSGAAIWSIRGRILYMYSERNWLIDFDEYKKAKQLGPGL